MIRGKPVVVSLQPRYAALIEIDADALAERYVIIDRTRIDVKSAGINSASGIIKILMPQHNAVGNNLIIGILDDDGVYNAKFVDGVKAQLVDANTVNMSQ